MAASVGLRCGILASRFVPNATPVHRAAQLSAARGAATRPEAEQFARNLAEENLTRARRLWDSADDLRFKAQRRRDQAEDFRRKGEEDKAEKYEERAEKYENQAEKYEDRAKEYVAEAMKYTVADKKLKDSDSESQTGGLTATCAHLSLHFHIIVIT